MLVVMSLLPTGAQRVELEQEAEATPTFTRTHPHSCSHRITDAHAQILTHILGAMHTDDHTNKHFIFMENDTNNTIKTA